MIMADRGMFSAAGLRPWLAERGTILSPAEAWRLVTGKPERLNLEVLAALIDLADGRMDELVVPVAGVRRRGAAGGKSAAAPGAAGDSGAGMYWPRRARVVAGKR